MYTYTTQQTSTDQKLILLAFLQCMWYLKCILPPKCGQDWPSRLCQLKLGNWLATQFPYLNGPLGQTPLAIPSSKATLTAYRPASVQALDHTQHQILMGVHIHHTTNSHRPNTDFVGFFCNACGTLKAFCHQNVAKTGPAGSVKLIWKVTGQSIP